MIIARLTQNPSGHVLAGRQTAAPGTRPVHFVQMGGPGIYWNLAETHEEGKLSSLSLQDPPEVSEVPLPPWPLCATDL